MKKGSPKRGFSYSILALAPEGAYPYYGFNIVVWPTFSIVCNVMCNFSVSPSSSVAYIAEILPQTPEEALKYYPDGILWQRDASSHC